MYNKFKNQISIFKHSYKIRVMSYLMNKLSTAIKSSNEQEIIDNLKTILREGTKIELSDIEIINQLLNIDQHEILILSTELIAEMAKFDINRNILTRDEIIKTLINFLESNDSKLIFNVIRALGNICYENEEACNIIDKIGINYFLKILEKDYEREDNLVTTKTLGLLVNLFSLHDDLVRSAFKSGIISILDQLLLKYSKAFEENSQENQMLITFLLSILSTLSEYFNELNITVEESSYKTVIDIFKISTNPEISVLCVEIFHGQSERDEIKTLLAKEGVCELLFELIEKHRHQVNDEDSRSVLKMACDLIVIILTGDDCMYMLYDNGEGKLYTSLVTWLDTDDEDLLSTGVLAIGNFARKDIHCIQMVKNGISKKLISILSKYNTSVDVADVKMQHALLSTLKNLVIPKQNKVQVLEEGLIDVIYPMIKIDQFLVVFKLLGTFRMVIDGQETTALDLISRVEFIERLVYWCYNSDHLGVRGEVPRLLAWLIKHCHSFKPFKNFINVEGSVKCIVEMISSNHALMQNEAFHALNLLCIGCSQSNSTYNGYPNTARDEDIDRELEKFMGILVEADIGKNLHFVINKYGEKMDKHTVENLLTLLEYLTKSRTIIINLNETKVKTPLLKIHANPNVHDIIDRLNAVSALLLE